MSISSRDTLSSMSCPPLPREIENTLVFSISSRDTEWFSRTRFGNLQKNPNANLQKKHQKHIRSKSLAALKTARDRPSRRGNVYLFQRYTLLHVMSTSSKRDRKHFSVFYLFQRYRVDFTDADRKQKNTKNVSVRKVWRP